MLQRKRKTKRIAKTIRFDPVTTCFVQFNLGKRTCIISEGSEIF